MRLAKNVTSQPLPYPLQSTMERPADRADLPEIRRTTEPVAAPGGASPRRDVADLIDLVANHRSDLLKTFLDVLDQSESSRAHAEELMDLVAACGVAETVSPCAAARAIVADLDQLLRAGDRWTHPTQIVERPNVQALYRLCAARLERDTGVDRERLEKILPRLERAARLTEKAASRRVQEASRQPRRWR